MFTTPLGNPASSINAATAKADRGVSVAGLITALQPAANAAPSFLVRILLLGSAEEILSPSILGASSENHSKKEEAYLISPRASARGFPFSIVQIFDRSSLFSTIKLYNFLNKRLLCLPVVSFLNFLNATSALFIALSTTAIGVLLTCSRLLPVAGSSTAKVSSEKWSHCPSTKAPVLINLVFLMPYFFARSLISDSEDIFRVLSE